MKSLCPSQQLPIVQFDNGLLSTSTMPTHHESQKRKEGEDLPPPTARPEKRAKTADENLRDRCANVRAHMQHI